MRLLQYLQEEYLDRFGYLKDNEIFINPTKDELCELGKDVRYIADFKHKNLYVWNGYMGVHSDIIDYLYNKGIFPYNWNNAMKAEKIDLSTGTGYMRGNKIEFEGSDALRYGENFGERKWFKADDSWLNQYFTKPYITTVMEQVGREKKRLK